MPGSCIMGESDLRSEARYLDSAILERRGPPSHCNCDMLKAYIPSVGKIAASSCDWTAHSLLRRSVALAQDVLVEIA